MEIHVQLKTQTKMFCDCLNETWKIGVEDLKPNKNTCPVCLGHPGTLPVANKSAIEFVIKAGLALNCKIAENSKFDRKNYFYPDLPKGYQISQYDLPLCEKGFVNLKDGKIGITRIHLEEDTGKLTHVADGSLVDYNRSSVPLMELVSEPDITSGAQAKEFCQELQAIFRELNISDANMEKGQMRCEVNVSISKDDKFGTKVEVKNLNSFKAVERAINYEIIRQEKALESGEEIIQETRGWNEDKGETYSQRKKEGSADYRYFPEPDIPPFRFGKNKNQTTNNKDNFIDVENIKKSLPELPQAKRERFKSEYGFKDVDAKILTANPELTDYTENILSELKIWLQDCGEFEGTQEEIWEQNKNKVTKLVSTWLVNKFTGMLTAKKMTFEDNKITAENFAELLTMILTSKVSARNATVLLERMLETGGDPSNILEDEDLSSGDLDLEKLVIEIINKNPEEAEKVKAGNAGLIKFFIGQAMKESQGKANPQEVENLFIQKLTP